MIHVTREDQLHVVIIDGFAKTKFIVVYVCSLSLHYYFDFLPNLYFIQVLSYL